MSDWDYQGKVDTIVQLSAEIRELTEERNRLQSRLTEAGRELQAVKAESKSLASFVLDQGRAMERLANERDVVGAELARVRNLARNCPGWGEASPCGIWPRADWEKSDEEIKREVAW